MSLVYKICAKPVWDAALKAGFFSGATIDILDGFIHLSSANQVKSTADLHFKTGDDLVLVSFDDRTLSGLKYEPSRGGELFPHVFGTIDTQLAISVFSLERQSDGSLKLPDSLA